MRSRMTRRHRHCVQARRLLFTYTMATIQASFANAAKFFNSLLSCSLSTIDARRTYRQQPGKVPYRWCPRQEAGPKDAGLRSSHARVGYRIIAVSSRGCLGLKASVGRYDRLITAHEDSPPGPASNLERLQKNGGCVILPIRGSSVLVTMPFATALVGRSPR